MMDDKQLVEAVVAEVCRRLRQGQGSGAMQSVVIGAEVPGFTTFGADCAIEDCGRLLITELAPAGVARLAAGMAADGAEQFILAALLDAKPVYVLAAGLAHRRFKQSTALAKYYQTCEEQLSRYGVQVIDTVAQAVLPPGAKIPAEAVLRHKNLVKVADVEALIEQGVTSVTVATDALVTPLAADLLRAHHILLSHGDRGNP